MSAKKRKRMVVMANVKAGRMSVRQAAESLGLSYRQAKRVWAQFFEAETTHASYDMVEGWAKPHGLPQSLYVDRDSIYRCEGVGSIEEQLAGKEPQTQFGRAMEKLGVELVLAFASRLGQVPAGSAAVAYVRGTSSMR